MQSPQTFSFLRQWMDRWNIFPCYGSISVLSVVRTRPIWVEVHRSRRRPLSDRPCVSACPGQMRNKVMVSNFSCRLMGFSKRRKSAFEPQITLFILIRHFSEQQCFLVHHNTPPPSTTPTPQIPQNNQWAWAMTQHHLEIRHSWNDDDAVCTSELIRTAC